MANQPAPGRNALDNATEHLSGRLTQTGSVEKMTDKAEELTDDAQKYARYAARRSQRAAENGLEAVESFIREQPLMTVAGAALFGLALGALWKIPNRQRSWTDQASNFLEPHYRAMRRYM